MLGLLCLDVLLTLFILINHFALRNYRVRAAEALRSFSDESRFQKGFRLVLKLLTAVFAAGFIALLFIRTEHHLNYAFSCLSAALLCALYGFVPFSSALWCITAEGIYIYRVRRLIPWSQIINSGSLKSRGQTFLTLQVKKQAGEAFKQVYYSCPLPEAELDETRQIVRDFMHALDRQRLMKRQKEERQTALKDRKFY